ncbi:MAG: hypothetical protein KC766_24515 [Myxococcales bacterium]|nr:hypothetical protein [Myxococcales bacterium]
MSEHTKALDPPDPSRDARDEADPAEPDEAKTADQEAEASAASGDAAEAHDADARPEAAPPRKQKPKLTTRLELWGTWLAALIPALCFALSFGFNYGISNQVCYMLGALQLVDPGLLTKDWYVMDTASFHPAFAYFSYVPLLLSPSGWGIAIAQFVVVTIGTLALFRLALVFLPPRRALATYLVLIAVMFTTETRSVAVSYIFDFILQPSTLGSTFLLLAWPGFVRGKYLQSGVFLGLSGLFHANYLVLGIPTFGLAHLLLREPGFFKRALRQLGPALLVFLMLSPLILHSAGGSPADAQRAREIYFKIRSPHHYRPETYQAIFQYLAAWQLMGVGAGAWLLRRWGARGRRFGSLVMATAAAVWVGTAASVYFDIGAATQAFPWRYAPFIDLLNQFLVAAACVEIAVHPRNIKRLRNVEVGSAIVGLCLLMTFAELHKRDPQIDALKYPLGLAALGCAVFLLTRLPRLRDVAFPWRKWRTYGGWVLALVLVYPAYRLGKEPTERYAKNSNLIDHHENDEDRMLAWVRENTPKDAVFVIPPTLERFRLIGERAVVVDWKANAIVPKEMFEWYDRLAAIAGRRNFRSLRDLRTGYDRMDYERFKALNARYGSSYAVVAAHRARQLAPGKVVYQNRRFAVVHE